MKVCLRFLCVLVVLLVSGCSHTTPIKELGLPPVNIIEGTVSQVNDNGFMLTNESGSIQIRAKMRDGKSLDLKPDEKVTVYGNLRGGQERVFDGYVIRKATGEQVIITKPTPHFGFHIQSSFD